MYSKYYKLIFKLKFYINKMPLIFLAKTVYCKIMSVYKDHIEAIIELQNGCIYVEMYLLYFEYTDTSTDTSICVSISL